jgi:hypothetical protein
VVNGGEPQKRPSDLWEHHGRSRPTPDPELVAGYLSDAYIVAYAKNKNVTETHKTLDGERGGTEQFIM